MDFLSIATGGFIGAAAAAILAGIRLKAAFAELQIAFHDYFDGRNDAQSSAFKSAFAAFQEDINSLSAALMRLRASFKRR